MLVVTVAKTKMEMVKMKVVVAPRNLEIQETLDQALKWTVYHQLVVLDLHFHPRPNNHSSLDLMAATRQQLLQPRRQ